MQVVPRKIEVGEGMVVKWFVSGESDGVADSDSDASRYRGMADESESLLVRAAMGTEDRKGDVIDSSGWVLEGYRENPVVLWAHDRSRPPIGRALRVWADEKGLFAEVEFAETELGEEVKQLYRTGFMRGISVGFLPLDAEVRKASDGRRAYLYRRQELLEISTVPVPMHPGALSRKDVRGLLLLDDEDVRLFGGWLKDLRRDVEWLLD